MSEWAAKRFWTETSVAEADGGYAVTLDGRGVKTPAKTPLVVPTQALAQLVAAEWDAQDGVIDPESMHFTRMSNSALDKVSVQHKEVADMLADYGDSDLLCYRADSPESLVMRQAKAWDPLLEWASRELGARLEPRTGVMHAPQAPAALAQLKGQVHGLSAFELTAFHDLVALSGSLILGFAAIRDHAPAAELWTVSRLDELWQEELWGQDEEAQEMSDRKKASFERACAFYFSLQPQSLR